MCYCHALATHLSFVRDFSPALTGLVTFQILTGLFLFLFKQKSEKEEFCQAETDLPFSCCCSFPGINLIDSRELDSREMEAVFHNDVNKPGRNLGNSQRDT